MNFITQIRIYVSAKISTMHDLSSVLAQKFKKRLDGRVVKAAGRGPVPVGSWVRIPL